MRVKLNLENIIVANAFQIGKAEFEYEGTVLEIKDSIELLPILTEKFKEVEAMLQPIQQQKKQPIQQSEEQPIQQSEEIIVTEPTEKQTMDLGNISDSLEALGITKESLAKLFQGGK